MSTFGTAPTHTLHVHAQGGFVNCLITHSLPSIRPNTWALARIMLSVLWRHSMTG